MSDLHLGVSEFNIPPLDEDQDCTLILAGDIKEGYSHLDYLKSLSKRFQHVIYVPGNHEFYDQDYLVVHDKWKDKTKDVDNLHFLDNESIVIDDVRIVCSTLWSDMQLDTNPLAEFDAKQNLHDYKSIRHGSRMFSPLDSDRLHKEAVKYIDSTLSKPFNGKTVVVTHHCPTLKFIEPRFQSSPVNFCFNSDLDWLFDKHDVDLAVFGHTHQCVDFEMYGTRYISNQRGYQSLFGYGEDTGFDPTLVVEL